MASLTSVCKGVLTRFRGTQDSAESAAVVNAAPSAASQELFATQDQVTNLQQQIQQRQAEARALAEQIAAIDLEANAAKIRLVGDVSGLSPALDRLDTERREVTRLREGIVLTIEALEHQLKPLVLKCGQLAQAVDQERQDAVVQRATAKMQRLADATFDSWREGCRSAYYLMKEVEAAANNSLNLDEAHRHQVLACLAQVNARSVRESAAHVNEHWRVANNRLPHLEIVPSLPPERIRRAS
jgi:chromosome segregation ATPase